MNNQVQVRNSSKWSLFQAFCCGTKTNKKKTVAANNANSNLQSNNATQQIIINNSSSQPSSPPPQIILNQYSSIQNQNNQTNMQMRGARGSYNQEDMDDSSSYSSNLQPHNQDQHQYQHFYQQNNVINIQNNRHSRQISSNIENNYQDQSRNSQNTHLIPPSQQQGFHSSRRTQSVNYNNMPSNQINLNQHQQYSEQRMDTQNSQASYSSHKTRYYIMTNQFFKLKTKFAIHEVDYVESRPTDKTFMNYFTYDCPICFRHFNKILKSDCCDHYLCHYCLRDIYNKARESNNFEYRCMFCQLSIPQYVDVDDSADKVKRYSDSPFITPKDNFIEQHTVKPFTSTSQFDHNIHNNNLIEFQDDSMDKENIDFKQNELNIINNCSITHNINKPPLPHLVLNQNMSVPSIQLSNNNYHRRDSYQVIQREKNGSIVENENVNQSAHKPAGTIPEFQNKYHCNYLQHSSTNNQRGQGISQITTTSSQQQLHSNIRQIR